MQILQFHQENQVCSSNMKRVGEVINDMGPTNYGFFTVWLKHIKLFVKMSIWIQKTNGHLLSKQLSFKLFWRYLAMTTMTDGGIAWFSSVPPGKFQDSSSN